MAKKSTGTARKNALVERKNEGGVGPKLDWTDEWRMATGRYADPLIVQKMHNKQNAFMREVVAEADPIASVLTHAFAENAAAKMIKFYESDQLDSPEIMMDLRAMLKVFKFQEYMKEVMLRGQTHGWWLIYPFVDEENQIPMVEIYSEYECEALRIHYDLNNKIQWYDVHFIPRVGFNRQTALRAVNRRFAKEQVMHGTRGTWRYGFGYSVFEGSWDAITKLREESHTNAFKQKIMPFVRVPDSWSKEQIDNFMAALSKIDMMSAMVMKAPLNEMTGEYQELPAVTWATPANNTPTKSSQGSGGSVSDLSSEWSRLTGATRRSVAYFVGGGALSASRAAAGVDSLDDLDADINDFNQYIDEFIIPFVKWFAATIGYALPDSFTVKGWWEWTRDEALYAKVVSEQQKTAAMNQIQQDQLQDKDRTNLIGDRQEIIQSIKDMAIKKDLTDEDKLFQSRVNLYHNNHPDQTIEESLMEVVAEIAHERRLNYLTESINQQYNHQNKMDYNDCERMALMVKTLAANRNNIIPNTIVPVNSISGNTEYAFLEQPDLDNQPEALWVKFKNPYGWYRYQERGEDMAAIADRIYQQGGEAVWKDLRGLDNTPRDENGKLPKGIPRAPAASRDPAPLAGRPHDAYGIPYQGMGSQGPKGALFTDMVAEGKVDMEQQLAEVPAEPEAHGIEQPSDYGILSEGPVAPPITIQAGGDLWDGVNTTAQTPSMSTIQDMTPKVEESGFGAKLKGLFMKAFGKTKIGRVISAAKQIKQGMFDNQSNIFNSDFGAIKQNIGIPIELDESYDKTLEYHPLLQQYNSVSGMRKNLHIGYEKAHELLDQEEKDCVRWNLAALATAMHTSNPFIYKMGDGYRIEYICPDSLRQLEGAEVPYGLWHNLDNESSTELPDWQIIGSYKVDQITGEKDLSTIKYIEGWEEKARVVIERLKEMGYLEDPSVRDWALNFIENVKKGIHGDVSTGIVTDVKYNKEKNKWVQTNIKLKSVSAVPIGNCTKPYCSTKNV